MSSRGRFLLFGPGLVRRLCVLAALAIPIAVLAFAGPALANAPIRAFTVTPSTTQAGGHPDVDTLVWVGNRESQGTPQPNCLCQDARNITVNLPTGLIGDPHATPQCSAADFATLTCPIDSQVGTVVLGVGDEEPGKIGGTGRVGYAGLMPVYNLIPHPGQAGLLGYNIGALNFAVFLEFGSRTQSDYGVTVRSINITQIAAFAYNDVKLWGVPAAASHDSERIGPVGCNPFANGVGGSAGEVCTEPHSSNSSLTPFLDNPTTCGVSLSATLEVLAYDNGESSQETSYPATTGCDQLGFNPSLYAQPTTTATDSPSGLEVDLQVPQEESPAAPSPSEIKATTVELPEGFSINPNAADGKTACTESEARFHTQEEAHCPESAKVGTLTLQSSALPGPLPGSVYLGQPQPEHRYRIYLVANGFGVHVKLAGDITPNPQTGQLTTSFVELPQSPFSEFNIHFFGSERGLLATPTRCGTYPVQSTFTPWNSFLPVQTSIQYFTLESGPGGAGCPGQLRPFNPGLQASSTDTAPGSHAPFFLDLTRSDGDQDLSGLTLTAPPGLSATLAGIPYCSDSALEEAARPAYTGLEQEVNPSCPAASQIGTSVAGAGAGDHPVYVSGKVYLAGPYKDAPLSLAIITPAVSGPYDLGNVVVRAALQVNPETAQVTAVSDPLPQILAGVPLRLRSVLINLNRPNFALNPTNCDPFSVNSEILGAEGALASPSAPFQVANCASLPYRPKLSLKLSGGLGRLGHPAIHAILTTKSGEANSSMVSVALPRGEILDNAHINGPCTRVELNANRCPAGSVLGHAVALTPLLEQPLEGPVYLATGFGHRLPDLIADLSGQIHIRLDGKVDTVNHDSLRTTFQSVPDAPVSTFTLDLQGGSKGLIENEKELCGAHRVAALRMVGQNGKTLTRNVPIQTSCGKGARQKHAGHHRAGGANLGGGR